MKNFSLCILLLLNFSAVAGEVGSYPNASALGGTERMLSDQSGATVDITPFQISTYIGSLPITAYSVFNNPTGSAASGVYSTSPETLGRKTINPSAGTNFKLWQESITLATGQPTYHYSACNDAGASCVDWLTLTRTDAANPFTVDNVSILTSSGGFSTNITIQPDQIDLVATENGDSMDCLIGTADLDCTAVTDADTLFDLENGSSGIHAYSRRILGANGIRFEEDLVPSSATSIGVLASCVGMTKPGYCLRFATGVNPTIGFAAGNGSFGGGAGGFVADSNTHATSDTNFFFYIPNVAGVPTGIPANLTGFYASSLPMRYDGTDNQLYLYNGAWKQIASAAAIPLTGTTGSIGGSLLAAGACSSGTVAVTNSTTAMAVSASPVTYPGDGNYWLAYVSTAGTVTVKVCAVIAGTPGASAYNVRVLQ